MYKVIKNYIKKHYDTPPTMEFTIVHVDLGTYTGTVATLKGVKSASYHDYARRKVAEIVEFVPIKFSAWHSGVVSKPIQAVVDLLKGRNPNRVAYGICYEGRPVDKKGRIARNWDRASEYGAVDGQSATDEQIDMLARQIMAKGMGDKPIFSHVDVTSYKPKVVKGLASVYKKYLVQFFCN